MYAVFEQVFAGHEDSVLCGVFGFSDETPNMVLTGSADSTVRVWSARTGKCRHTFRHRSDVNWFHEGVAIVSIAAHPTRRMFIAGGGGWHSSFVLSPISRCENESIENIFTCGIKSKWY